MTKLSVYMYNTINVLRRMGVDWRDRRLIGNLNMGQKIRVKIEGEFSEPRSIGRGVRQGHPTLTYTVQPIYRRTSPRSTTGLGRRSKGGRKADKGAVVH